ncbi:MAG: hypothetical protein QOF93_1407 [Verrucomicrobiota bacterium]
MSDMAGQGGEGSGRAQRELPRDNDCLDIAARLPTRAASARCPIGLGVESLRQSKPRWRIHCHRREERGQPDREDASEANK